MSARPRRSAASGLASRLRSFVEVAKPSGAWLGIREGSGLRLVSTWHATGLRGSEYEIHGNALLRQLKRTRRAVVCQRGRAEWASIPDRPGKRDAYWACIPLLAGRELVGAVGMWGARPPTAAVTGKLSALAKRLGPNVDAEAKLENLATDLGQAALVAETSGEVPASFGDIQTLVPNTLRRLSRAIPDATLALVVPDWRSRTYREYRLSRGRLRVATSRMLQDLTASSPKVLPAADARRRKHGIHAGAAAAIPLGWRVNPEGALWIGLSYAAAHAYHIAFIRGRIAPPLAQLIAQARDRARRALQEEQLHLILGLSGELAGLADPRQVVEAAAGKIAQLFDGALTRIVLSDGGTTALMAAAAGSVGARNRAEVGTDVAEIDKALSSRVLRTGQSLLVRGAEATRSVHLEAARFKGSAVCVPIKDQVRTLGTIEVRSDATGALDRRDLESIECLSAIVASAVTFARSRGEDGDAPSSASRRPQRIPEDRLIRAARLISVGEMAAGIAHELNNPLTTVTGFAELVLDEIPQDAAYRADVEMVLKEARRARSVVRRLLDFARQGEGTRSRSDIGEIVEDVLGLTTHLMRTNGVRLEFVREEGLPWVLANTNQLKQVFLNMVHNALQAMPAGGKLTVVIELQREAPQDWVVVRIKDDGVGIRPGDLSRIFEPFFTTRAEHGGTGLGLSVSYGIVSEHGGRIDVESQPGRGSTFTVWLPV